MRYLINFLRFWYDFIVGDDWTMAAGVVISLLVLGLAMRYADSPALDLAAAFLLPLAIVALLAYSLWRVRGTGGH